MQPQPIADNECIAMPTEMRQDLFRKIQIITDSEIIQHHILRVLLERFVCIRRTDLGQAPYRFDTFNIVMTVQSDTEDREIDFYIHKNTMGLADYGFSAEHLESMRMAVSEFCKLRIDTLVEIYLEMNGDTDPLPEQPSYGVWIPFPEND